MVQASISIRLAPAGGFGLGLGLGAAMIQAKDIRDQLIALLRRDISVAMFERWMDSESFNMFNEADENAIDLVSSFHVLLGDYYDDRISVSEFRAYLQSLVDNIVVCAPVDLPVERQICIRFAASSRPVLVSFPHSVEA